MDRSLSSSTSSKPSGLPRPSGIPRPSRLPQPQATRALRVDPSQSLRPSPSVEGLRQKSSRSSLTSSSRISQPSTVRKTPSTASLQKGARQDDHAFKKPLARPPSRQDRVTRIQTQSIATVENKVEEDQLGDLDGFRASSRQGAADGESPTETDLLSPEDVTVPKTSQRKARPSLSDRTVESLSQVPPSPAARRRQSGFFTAESPVRSTNPKAAARLPSPAVSSRKTLASDGPSTSLNGTSATPSRRSVSATNAVKNAATPSKTTSLATPSNKSTLNKTTPRQLFTGSKTMPGRTPKPRPSLGALRTEAEESLQTPQKSARKGTAEASSPQDSARKVSNSSAALREQIAKARAAKRTAASKPAANTPGGAEDFDYEANADPFNQGLPAGKGVLKRRIDGARSDGRLNISAMGLSSIPDDVLKMYEFDPDSQSIAWSEAVDLVRFMAADNDLENIRDDIFPDVDPYDMDVNDDSRGPQFAGVELLDLHGNLLQSVPVGLRQLRRLSVLNLSRNRLDIASLATISQIESLKELKLPENALEGPLPDSIGALSSLEVLELQGNSISELPDAIGSISQLRILNVSNNKISDLRFRVLPTNLVELFASKNQLSGVLIPESVTELSRLGMLNVSNNSISSLATHAVSMPNLSVFNASVNRLSDFPDISSWQTLATFIVDENSLSTLPPGFTSLQSLKQADFTGNSIVKIDEQIASMESLEVLRIAANPLRERKFLTMGAEDIKRDLAARLAPPSHDEDADHSDAETVIHVEEQQRPSGWTLKPSGLLDLSSKGFAEFDHSQFESLVAEKDVRQVSLQNNKLRQLPPVLSMAPTLTLINLSNNALTVVAMQPMALPQLRELRLPGNKLQSFDSLLSNVEAPKLQQLDVTYNRISGELPHLGQKFPQLIVLSASNNAISEISAEALAGLKSVDLSNNDIGVLPPEIGRLGDSLTTLKVEGNRFRVPQYAVLLKGTEAIMAWLRDRLPEPEAEDELD